MALFIVLSLRDANDAIDNAVGSVYPSSSYKIESGKWVVSVGGISTAKELSEKLGVREVSHLVLAIRGYSGRAQGELWEWLRAQVEKSNA